MLKLGRYPPKKIQSSHLKFEAGTHSLHNLFWLVKDTFLTTTEATSSSTFDESLISTHENPYLLQ